MNERELSLINALGEEFGLAIQKMADNFQQALEKTAGNLEKQLEEVRQSIPEFKPVEIPDISKMVIVFLDILNILIFPLDNAAFFIIVC